MCSGAKVASPSTHRRKSVGPPSPSLGHRNISTTPYTPPPCPGCSPASKHGTDTANGTPRENVFKEEILSYNSVFCLLSDGLESRGTQRRDHVSELLLLFLHSGFGCRGLYLSAVRGWELAQGQVFPVWLRKVVLLDVVGMRALAHGLVCPGVVNAQRFSAAVEAAPAALCRPVSRGWGNISQCLLNRPPAGRIDHGASKRRYLPSLLSQ